MSNINVPDGRSTPPLIHWVDTGGMVRDPVPYETLLGWIDAGHLPENTPTWWDGLEGWTTAPELRAMIAGSAAEAAAPAAPAPASAGAAATEATAVGAPVAGDLPDAGDLPEAQPSSGAGPSWANDPVPAASADDLPAAASEAAEQPTPDHAAAPTPAAFTERFDDDELDNTFIELVGRSSEIYQESERAASIDDVFLSAVISAFAEGGYVLTDVVTGGSLRTSGSTSAARHLTTPQHRHELRFADPVAQTRVAMIVDYLTPDLGTAEVLGQRARVEVGYGQRVPNFGSVGRALRDEAASVFVVSPEPGRVTFDADLSGEFVYCQVDLLCELDRYVDAELSVDAELLAQHLAAIVHTLRSTLQLRFAS